MYSCGVLCTIIEEGRWGVTGGGRGPEIQSREVLEEQTLEQRKETDSGSTKEQVSLKSLYTPNRQDNTTAWRV